MATKPKAILSTHDGREASPITRASNVLFENGQTAQDILDDRQDAMISPVIENSSSMFKVGQGDNVDYSANVVNGAYESMVLKGKSMVNCIQESSSQDVVLPYEFEEGQYVTINDTKESGALGVELKGQTLVNLHKLKNYSVFGVVLDGGINQHFGNDTSYATWRMFDISMLKPNTEYGVFCWVLENTISENFWDGHIHHSADTVFNPSTELRFSAGETGLKFAKLTTISDFTGKTCGIRHLIDINTPSSEYVKFRCVIVEYQDGMENWDIPYFEGMANVNMPTVKTYNGEYDFQVGKYMTSGTLSDGQHWLFFNCKPNTKYEITVKSGNYNRFGVYSYNGELGKTLTSDKTFYNYITANPNTVYSATGVTGNKANLIGVYLSNNNHNTTLDDVVLEVLENGRKLSDKTSILSLPEEVVLRGIGDIKDTLDLMTGEVTERIGEIVLDGSEDWLDYTTPSGGDDYISFSVTTPKLSNRKIGFTNSLCDGMKIGTSTAVIDEFIEPHPSNPSMNDWVMVRILKSRLETTNVSGFKKWLSNNPLTLQYELIEKSIKTVDLNVVDQNGSVIPTLKSWNTTTHIYSEIPENSLYPILSHSNPTYPVILKPSTKYSIVANSYSNNHTNSAINFNLGGATASTTVGNRVTTITTPSTLTSEELVMSGRGNKLNNAMVIEGDVVGDEPYFEGICDCKSPILSNVGENLFTTNNMRTGNIAGNSSVVEGNDIGGDWQVTDYIPVKPLIEYYHSTSLYKFEKASFYDINKKIIYGTGVNYFKTGVISTPQQCAYVRYVVMKDSSTNNSLSLEELVSNNDIVVAQGSSNIAYKPYKSNILSVNGDKIELTEDMFEQGTLYYERNTFEDAKSFADDDSSTRSFRIRSKKLIKVKPNTTYRFSYKNSCQSWFYGYDMNENPTNSKSTVVGVTEQVFTTNASTHYIALVLFKTGNPTITPSNYDYKSIQIREVDKTIVLRSLPNGVCDTLNVETGEYVQRIKQIVLDGSENWSMDTNGGGATRFYNNMCTDMGIKHGTISSNENLICDKFSHPTTNIWIDTNESIQVVLPNGLYFIFNNAQSVIQWKEYLQSNPITVQYQLAEPIIKTVDLSGYPFSYENGHVILSSGSIEQSLTPKVEYSVATNRNGQIRSNQKMVERHQKQLDQLQAIILANLVNSQYNQTLTTLKYELSRV